MRKTRQLSIRAGSAFAAGILATGLSAQAQPVTVIKTGLTDGGENICFGFDGAGYLVGERCSWFAGRPEADLIYENEHARPKNTQNLAAVFVDGGELGFSGGSTPYMLFRFENNYLGETGWKAMRASGASFLGSNCVQARKSGTGYTLFLHLGADIPAIPGFSICSQRNIPENQVWLETLQPPSRSVFLKIERPIKGSWPNPTYITPGEDTSALPRLCAGFDSTSQTWVFDRCDKLSVDRKDARLQYGGDQSIRNASGRCLTRKTTVGTEVSFESCVTPNDFQRFAPVDKHGGDPYWSAVVATAGPVDGGSRLSSGEMQPVTPNTPSAGCLAVNPSSSRMFFGHCETYTYQNNYRTLRGASNTMSILDVPN